MSLSEEFYKNFNSRDDWGKLGDNHPDVLTLRKLADESEGHIKIPVRQYHNCRLVREYEDKEQAAAENNIHPNNLLKALVGDSVTCDGYEWRYETDDRPLKQGGDRGEFVIVFDKTYFIGKYSNINSFKQPIFSTVDRAKKYVKKDNVERTKRKLEKMIGKRLKVINLEEGEVNRDDQN